MTAPLEMRYRRLLAAYPADHRRTYEEEMVGVLMEGAQPGQNRPALGEILNLLRSGLAARLGRGAEGLRSAVWRDAAAVAALIGVALLAAAPGRRLVLAVRYLSESGDPMRAYGVDGGLLIDVGARAGAWIAVLVAVLLAAKRTAVALAVVALLVEIAAIALWLPRAPFQGIRMSWVLALALLTVALLALSREGRTALAVLGRRGLALLAAATALVVTGMTALRWVEMPPQVMGLITVTDAVLMAAGAVLLAGLRQIPGRVRRRLLVLLAALAAVPLAQRTMEDAIGIYAAPVVTPAIVLVDILIMVGVPLLVVAVALGALFVRENLAVSVTRKPAGEAA